MEAAQLVPGYRLDRYELLCPIASGGMASVWLARLRGKRGFEKLFAIKTIKTELISDPNFQEMFLDEARIASRIIHPNVAQILELGEQDDVLYIVMEYVDGDSVAKVNRLALKRGTPLPPGVSMRIMSETCAGLHAAHQLKDEKGEHLGVVHRDVSPQNILLTIAGTAKVIDFGLVKAKNRGAAETQSGVVKGKIRYMAPEQVNGRAIDHRADVWAAGMCLYELITGHAPYPKDDDLAVVQRLTSNDPLPPFDVALPAQIEKILTRAIVKDPNGRFESCAAMRRAIDAAIIQLDLPAENDDVAEFVRQTLPELATKRAATIAQAVEAAATRSPKVASLEGLGPGDMAFAATEVLSREKNGRDVESTDVLPLTKRLPARASSSPGTDDHEHSDGSRSVVSDPSRGASVTSLTQQLQERRRRSSSLGYWLAALAILGAGGWVLWPSIVRRIAPPTIVPTAATESSSSSTTIPSSEPPLIPSGDPSALPALSATPDPLDSLAVPDAGKSRVVPKASLDARGRPHPIPSAASARVGESDGGLSPGAASAAKIMLAPKSDTPAPPPSATPPAPPPAEHP